ncbi:Yip1-interacting factor 1 [Carabus blaptoides fortunei]
MNFNANASQRQPLGRKVKRVSDVNAMGLPTQQPPMNAYSHPVQFPNANEYNQQPPVYADYPPTAGYAGPPPVYQPNTDMPMQQSQFNILSQPVVQDMALQYGQQLADTGKHLMKTEIERYVPVTRLKYYFAVDTKYVLSKIKLLFFPFAHDDWSIKYEQDNPVQPRFEVNAPDLYIPTMAYVTYVLVAGLVLGMQNRFSPEQIGIQASSALAWSIVEIAVYAATLYITNIRTMLRTFDLLAYSGYKYLGIIASVLVSLAFSTTGYYVSLVYCNFALAFFLMRSLKAQVLPDGTAHASPTVGHYYGDTSTSRGSKRRLYFLLFVAVLQPVLSWWLTFHLVAIPPSVDKVAPL